MQLCLKETTKKTHKLLVSPFSLDRLSLGVSVRRAAVSYLDRLSLFSLAIVSVSGFIGEDASLVYDGEGSNHVDDGGINPSQSRLLHLRITEDAALVSSTPSPCSLLSRTIHGICFIVSASYRVL
ncbi:hypothetical protein P8452_28148 [Trifolium repens]|nr:hypothetical protein P8452_28148 [Trifolium repens]